MLWSFALPLWMIWSLITLRVCYDWRVSANLTKGSWLTDYVGGFLLSALVSLPAFWLIVKVQSAMVVTGFFLFLVICGSLLIGGWLSHTWLNFDDGKVARYNFVRNSFWAFPFLAAGLYWLSALLLPGVLTPVDAYVLKYSTIDLVADAVIGLIILGFFVRVFIWSLE